MLTRIFHIDSMFLFGSHIVKGRVTSKTGVLFYGGNGGRMFYFVIMDESVSVRVKAFNNSCDRIFSLFTCGNVSVD